MKDTVTVRFNSREEYEDFIDSAPEVRNILSRDLGGGRKHDYVPIHYQKSMADFVFQYWAVIDEKVTYTTTKPDTVSATVIVTISYTPSYPDAPEMITTGIAATPLTSKINSAEYGVPKAEAQAIGNALDKVGNIFGQNVGQKVTKDGKTFKVPADYSIRRKAKEMKKEKENNQ